MSDFRLSLLLRPSYVSARLREIRSLDDLLGRTKRVFIHIYGRLAAAYHETLGLGAAALDRLEKAGYAARGLANAGVCRLERGFHVARGWPAFFKARADALRDRAAAAYYRVRGLVMAGGDRVERLRVETSSPAGASRLREEAARRKGLGDKTELAVVMLIVWFVEAWQIVRHALRLPRVRFAAASGACGGASAPGLKPIDSYFQERFFGLRWPVIKALWRLRLYRKLSNYVLAEVQLKLGSQFLLARPYWIDLDPNSGCDLHCPFCSTGNAKGVRTRAMLRWDHFKATMDTLGPTLLHVEFSNWGEPLLNPLIHDMIRYAKSFGIEVHLSSNFNLVDAAGIERLLDSGLDWLIMSIDGTTPESYAKYRVGGDFDRVMENVRTIVAARRRRGARKPYLIWQFLVFRHNEHQIDDAIKLGREIGVDRVSVSRAGIPDPDWIPVGPGAKYYPAAAAGVADVTNPTALAGNAAMGLPMCAWPWIGAAVNSNGSWSPCCVIDDERFDYGNAFTEPLGRIWNGLRYMKSRRSVATGRNSGFKTACTECTLIGKVNMNIPDWWQAGDMNGVPLDELFRPLPLPGAPRAGA